MKVAEELRFRITDLDQDGAGVGVGVGVGVTPLEPGTGVGRPAARALEIHVAGTLPGEEISARLDDVSAHRPVAWATLRTIHRASPDRVPPSCRAHGRCGGCVLQHYAPEAQAAWKETWLRRQVAGTAAAALATVPVRPIVTSPASLGYRNNSKLVAAREESGKLVLGAYARRTHDVVDLGGCAIIEPPLGSTTEALRGILQDHAIEPYDELRFTGSLRYVLLRSSASGAVLVTLVTADEAFPGGASVAEALRRAQPQVAGVVHNINPSRGNALHGPRERTLVGEATFEDRIGAVRLRVSSRAFFQANRRVAQAAYEAIRRALAPQAADRVLDAYAGVGGIALTLAPGAHSVVGIEEHADAARDAEASARLNGITNSRFVAGDVAHQLSALDAMDLVVLNPPRKGCAAGVLRQVAALGPRRIAYLSCAPATLLRDLLVLAGLGYVTEEITPFDMLPHTPHIEALAVLRRAEAS